MRFSDIEKGVKQQSFMKMQCSIVKSLVSSDGRASVCWLDIQVFLRWVSYMFSVSWSTHLSKRVRNDIRFSRCGGLSLHVWVGWVGGWDQKWTDSGSLGRLVEADVRSHPIRKIVKLLLKSPKGSVQLRPIQSNDKVLPYDFCREVRSESFPISLHQTLWLSVPISDLS